MLLFDFISKDCIKVPLESSEKTAAINEMVDLLAANGLVDDRDKVVQTVMDREALMSTGIGNGIAIPHGKTDAVDHIVGAIGVTDKPLDFDSVDGSPVRLIILVVSSTAETGPHIRALANISKLLNDDRIRNMIIDAPTADSVFEIVQTESQRQK